MDLSEESLKNQKKDVKEEQVYVPTVSSHKSEPPGEPDKKSEEISFKFSSSTTSMHSLPNIEQPE